MTSIFESPAPTSGAAAAALSDNPAYREAFNKSLAEPNPMARQAHLAVMEQIARGAVQPAPQGGQPSTPPSRQAYNDAVQRAVTAPTPQAADHWNREAERLAQAGTLDEAPAATVPEGFEPPAGPHEYVTGPSVAALIVDEAHHAELKGAAAEAGVPSAFWNQSVTEAARLNAALPDQAAYEAEAAKARQQLAKVHGEDAVQIAKDGLSYLDALERAHPSLGEAVDLLAVSPWALATAAQMWRAGIRPAAPKK
jgi:hypothetical protein